MESQKINLDENLRQIKARQIEQRWSEAVSNGNIDMSNPISEDRVVVPEGLKGISEQETIDLAKVSWMQIMPQVRNSTEIISTNEWGYFMLPSRGRDKDDSTKPRFAPLAFLPTAGCGHMLECGGCLMCDYGRNGSFSEELLMAEAKKKMDFVTASNEGYSDAFFNVNALGSFFDEKEISKNVRVYILNRIAEYAKSFPGKKVGFFTESRLEFITEENMAEMRSILGDETWVEIGYGMESSNPLIRDGAFNKLLPTDFENRVALLRGFGVEVVNHIMLKPPFLTEKEAVQDAIQSIRDSHNKNWADFVVVMTINVRGSTLVGVEKLHGLYKMPSIWGVVEVMKEIGYEMAKKSVFFGFAISEFAQRNGTQTVSGSTNNEMDVMQKILRFNGLESDYYDIVRMTEKGETSYEYNKWKKGIEELKPKSTIAERIASHIALFAKIYKP